MRTLISELVHSLSAHKFFKNIKASFFKFFILSLSLSVFLSLTFFSNFVMAVGKRNQSIDNFQEAKRFLNNHLDLFDNKTIYCSCQVKNKKVDLESCQYKVQSDVKRAQRMEWEHVVPAEAFGQSFSEWREGSEKCIKHKRPFKGRKCAEKNPEFAKMESDLYNLFPEIGELNGLRSNYSMAQLSSPTGKFGKCQVKLNDNKFEPQDSAKGIVARTYMNMDSRYPNRGIISDKNKELFIAWNKKYPLTPQECRRWKALRSQMTYDHLFMKECSP